ncbi:uncharacterized protein V1510DRAFT_411887 [Dipodascopsis tothii]|uniref:uncharacterized protein n=1 Tax=Dipodascopsis tothii TaxID=44089 RepID=UPI0034CF5C44
MQTVLVNCGRPAARAMAARTVAQTSKRRICGEATKTASAAAGRRPLRPDALPAMRTTGRAWPGRLGAVRAYAGPPGASAEDILVREYHAVADETMEAILLACEDLAESFPEIDVELAQGVLNLEVPGVGIYVINKQPPNRQIWLSSPLSGPKRYDYVDGKWTYGRDGSTLGDLLRAETSEALETECRFEGIDD